MAADTSLSVPASSRRWPHRRMTDEQRLENCNLDSWTNGLTVIKPQSSGKEPTLTEAIAARTAELRDPEKRWQRQNYNSTLRKRRDGLLKKIHELTMLSNQKTYTPVYFATQLFGRWYIYNSEDGRSNDWFPSKEFLSKTTPTPRVHTPVQEEAARLQALVVKEEKKQAKLGDQARREEALRERPTDPASIEKLLDAMAEEKAELAKAKFQLRRGQVASAIGAIRRQERARASANYVAEVLAAGKINFSEESNAEKSSSIIDISSNDAEVASIRGYPPFDAMDTSSGTQALDDNHEASSLPCKDDHMAVSGAERQQSTSSASPVGPTDNHSERASSDRNSVLIVELPSPSRELNNYQYFSGKNLGDMVLDESESDCDTGRDSEVGVVVLDEDEGLRAGRKRLGSQRKNPPHKARRDPASVHPVLASPVSSPHRRRLGRPKLRMSTIKRRERCSSESSVAAWT